MRSSFFFFFNIILWAGMVVINTTRAAALASPTVSQPVPKEVTTDIQRCVSSSSPKRHAAHGSGCQKPHSSPSVTLSGPHMFPRPLQSVGVVTHNATGCCIERLAAMSNAFSLADRCQTSSGGFVASSTTASPRSQADILAVALGNGRDRRPFLCQMGSVSWRRWR